MKTSSQEGGDSQHSSDRERTSPVIKFFIQSGSLGKFLARNDQIAAPFPLQVTIETMIEGVKNGEQFSPFYQCDDNILIEPFPARVENRRRAVRSRQVLPSPPDGHVNSWNRQSTSTPFKSIACMNGLNALPKCST